MSDDTPRAPANGATHKAEVVFQALCDGHHELPAIASVTELAPTTVIRVVAMLRDLGRIEVVRGPNVRFVPLSPG